MRIILFILLLSSSCSLLAQGSDKKPAPRIQLNAILKNAAVITVNGQQQMLHKNASSREGYKLISIKEKKISLLIKGETVEIKLGASITTSKSAKSGKQLVNIRRDDRGMYLQAGKINDFSVDMLVDTGATYIAINSVLAEQIGLDYLQNGKPTLASTASGMITAYKLVLENVSLGDVELSYVDAMIIEGNFPEIPLLGMSFLKRVKMSDDGNLLTIEEKF